MCFIIKIYVLYNLQYTIGAHCLFLAFSPPVYLNIELTIQYLINMIINYVHYIINVNNVVNNVHYINNIKRGKVVSSSIKTNILS